MSLDSQDPRAAGSDELTVELEFELNGSVEKQAVPTSTTVLDLLRNGFGKRGVRSSCERSVCGACTVLVDDLPVAACSTFAFDIDGTRVETVEGLAAHDGTLSAQQRAFRECGGFQCGFCTSGMLMLTTGLLRANPQPDREEIREWISSNTCRCTGYEMILESVERAAELAREREPDEESS
jgi:carbon-monoxide dehydrogenase small subunit